MQAFVLIIYLINIIALEQYDTATLIHGS